MHRKQILVCLYDKKAQTYFPPTCHINKSVALRDITQYLMDPRNPVAKYPHDYSIWVVGEWNEDQGQITSFPNPVILEEAANLTQKTEANPNG